MASVLGHHSEERLARPQAGAPEAAVAPAARRVDWATLLPCAVAAGLLLALAWPILKWWHWEYTKPESYYTHAFLIPFLVGLMLWHRRDALRAVPKTPCAWAVLVLVPALALHVFATKLVADAIMSWTFLLTIVSSVWLLLGTRFVRAAAFPLAFLWLMAPLPGTVLNDSTLGLQRVSTLFADKLLSAMMFHPSMVGNVITMDNYSLFVDVPCSGFKMLLSLLTFSAAFVYLVDGPAAKRLWMFLFCIPLALLVNAVRIALIGVVGECVGADAAHVFHDWSGTITLCLGFVALFSLAKGIGCRTFAGWPIF